MGSVGSSVPFASSCCIGLAWFSAHMLLARAAVRTFGTEVIEGTPRWRSAAGPGTSLVTLPAIFAASLWTAGSFDLWSQRCAELGLGVFDWGFFLVFTGLMITDFVQGVLCSYLLIAHHLVCILCHLFACFFALAAFPFYFAGVVALELGSAATCVHSVWPKAFPASRMMLVMTVSNVFATLCTSYWFSTLLDTIPISSWIGSLISCVLVLLRQKDAIEVYWASRRRTH